MSEQPAGTVTFLFTDIEGSTKRWEQYPQQMDAALARHDAMLRAAIEASGGYVFKTVGDAFCAAFSTAHDALDAALHAQRALHDEEWGESGAIQARMALHTGACVERDGDYFGQPVNRVARLLSAGHGGQILLSSATQELVRDRLPPDAALLDLGVRRLKDLVRPERVFQIAIPRLPADFPPLKTLDNRPNNLPVQPTPLIGREKEVAAITTMFRRPDVRLITLTGPGGTGKTRLGLQAAADLVEEFEDGVYFVALAPISDPGLVVSTIAQTLGVRESGGQPIIETLKEYLREKQMLLLLDNFEQVVSAAPLLADLISAAPQLKTLVTSRELLRLRGEHNFPVPPLNLPDTEHLPPLDRLAQYEAVRLFIERALAVKPDFAVTNENAPAVAEICHRLDGLPLAIELAAARVRLLPPQAMLARLESRLKLLTGGARDHPARQQTLRNTIEWSYDLLDDGEKTLFQRLAVFVGGCTLEAVEAVCKPGDVTLVGSVQALDILDIYVLDGLTALVDKSLLRQDEREGVEARYRMLETMHEYAREKLEESEEAETVRRWHAHFFLRLAEEAKPELRGGPQQSKRLEQLEMEHDNLRAALNWAIERGDEGGEVALRLAGATWDFWWVRGHWTEGRRWLHMALDKGHSGSTAARAEALYDVGYTATFQGDLDSAQAFLEESLLLYQEQGDERGIVHTLLSLSNVSTYQGDNATAQVLLDKSWVLCKKLGEPVSTARALTNMGAVAQERSDYANAQTLYRESLALWRELGDKSSAALILSALGEIALQQDQIEQAQLLAIEALALCWEVGHKMNGAYALAQLAGVAGAQGNAKRAALLFGIVEALRETVGIAIAPGEHQDYERHVLDARAQLDEVAWQAAWQEGHAMTWDQAIAYALEDSQGE